MYKNCGGIQRRPPPLFLEVYLDFSGLTNSQTLVIVDDNGKRWNVIDALGNSMGSSDHSHPRKTIPEVILERWKIELQDSSLDPTNDFTALLPTVYKKCIVFFRSLYATAKFVPAWRFVKSLAKNNGIANAGIKVRCRISSKSPSSSFDSLKHPLFDSREPVTTTYVLGTTDTPVGQFLADVTYRNDCSFRIDDSESMLSSQFMGVDENYFAPSLGGKAPLRQPQRPAEVGSLPAHRRRDEPEEPIQAYGSLSTFHGEGAPLASSPISALRAIKAPGSDASSPPIGASPRSRPIYASRGSLRSLEGVGRRTSVSFQPFKAGSLSSSPGRSTPVQQGEGLPPQSPHSLPRASGISALTQARNRSSLTAGMPASLRGGPPIIDNVVASSASSSPKPAPISRYSSSFSHRRGRSSFGGSASRVLDEDQNSSGKQSLSSSVQPGSGVLAEAGAGASSGSLQTDDDNISEFLKMLDSKRTLTSFQTSGDAATKRTSAQLSKFQSMRESNNALTDSMSSSLLLHRSSSSSSRQLSSVPPMVAATSMSASSSPGKPISPHTPHTPAVPSRLSANSIVEYNEPRIRRPRTTDTRLEEAEDDVAPSELGTNAIDIPTSPRTYYPHTRRSSSVAQRVRTLVVEDDLGDLPFGAHRSISLGADDREPPSLSSLRGINQDTATTNTGTSDSPRHILQPAPIIPESAEMSRQPSSSLDPPESESQPQTRAALSSVNSPYKARLARGSGRGLTPPTGSYSSLSERGGGSVNSERGGRGSITRNTGNFEADDEPLVFDMSEMGEHSRRSIEENRGHHAYDSPRGGDSGSSSRRGSRRGWP